MTDKRLRVRLLIPGVWLVVGCALALGAYSGNMVGLSHAITMGAIFGATIILVVGRGGSDLSAVFRAERDERQSFLDVRARSLAALGVFVVCAAQAARWYSNGHGSRLGQPYLIVCTVEVIAYLASLLWLAFRQNSTTKNAVP
jgi:hypothetical protein